VSRTVFLGKPTQAFLDAEAAVLEGMDAGLAAARSGNTCEDIANAFFAVLQRHGIETMGLEMTESILITERSVECLASVPRHLSVED